MPADTRETVPTRNTPAVPHTRTERTETVTHGLHAVVQRENAFGHVSKPLVNTGRLGLDKGLFGGVSLLRHRRPITRPNEQSVR